MGSSHWPGSESAHSELSEAFRAAFQAAADEFGVLRFDRFMQLALYHPTLGYYRRDRQRIGFVKGSDFFTAASSNPVFGELIAAACVTLLVSRTPADYTFVEIGAESDGGVLDQTMRELEVEARRTHRGLWSDAEPIPPWVWIDTTQSSSR